jgi:Flp pilus assembly protein TadD
LFREKGDFAVAEQWYRAAIEHSPRDAQGYILLGAMLARLGRLDEAEQTHRQATLCTAGCIDEAYHNLGLVLRAVERFSEALSCFESALRIDPQYKVARIAARDVKRVLRMRKSSASADD